MNQQTKATKEKILIADNEEVVRKRLKTRLTQLGYIVFLASDGKEALHLFQKENPDLVIIDVLLPYLDGYKLCLKIREQAQTPLIMLTPLNEVSDRVMGFELGADDYIIKPFSLQELEARIRSLLRRSNLHHPHTPTNRKNSLKFGNLLIDFQNYQVYKNQRPLKLTSIEFNILELLIENPGKKLSRMEILTNIWGYTPERYVDTRIVDVHISRLRGKIEETSKRPEFILTVRGTGYMFSNW